ncbi:hypothetical protein [Actinoallomurus acaciae]|uniref:Uncharacterized protein n=1 Tax=Actinoallomurus acaciae TaxID=502577 RepID=A0ABV5YW77_9ACTN
MRAQQSGTAAEGDDVVNIADRASGPDQPRVPDAVPYSPPGGPDGFSSGREANPASGVVRAADDSPPTVSVHGGIAVKR